MTCDEVRLQIVRADDEGLEIPGHLAEHFDTCDDCRQAIADQRAVRETMRSAHRWDLPDGFESRLHRRLDLETGLVAGFDWQRWTYRLAPVAAALLMAALYSARSQTGASVTTSEDVSKVMQTWAIGEAESSPTSVLWQEDVGHERLMLTVLTGRNTFGESQ